MRVRMQDSGLVARPPSTGGQLTTLLPRSQPHSPPAPAALPPKSPPTVRAHRYASAFHYFSTSINLKPDFPSSYMYLAITLNRLDDFDNACQARRPRVPACRQRVALARAAP